MKKNDLFLRLKELLSAASTAHAGFGHHGWAKCECYLAVELRNAENALFAENRRRKREQRKKVA